MAANDAAVCTRALITAYEAVGHAAPHVHLASDPFEFAKLLAEHDDPDDPVTGHVSERVDLGTTPAYLASAAGSFLAAAQRAAAFAGRRLSGRRRSGRSLAPDLARAERLALGECRIHADHCRVADLAAFTALARAGYTAQVVRLGRDFAPDPPAFEHSHNFWTRFSRTMPVPDHPEWIPAPRTDTRTSGAPIDPAYALFSSTAPPAAHRAPPPHLDDVDELAGAFHVIARNLLVLVPRQRCAVALLAPVHEDVTDADFPRPGRGSWIMPAQDVLPVPRDSREAPRATHGEIRWLRRALGESGWRPTQRLDVVALFHPADVVRAARARPTESARDADFYRIPLPESPPICLLAVRPRCEDESTDWHVLELGVPDLARARSLVADAPD